MSLASIDTGAVGMPIRVMVLADVQLYREGLSRLLSAEESIVLAGAGPINGHALERIVATRPDVVLLEGPAACETMIVQDLAKLAPEIKVLAYGVQDEERQALRCAEFGVAAFVMADATGQELIGAILGLARGEFRCSPRVAAMLVRRVSALAQGRGQDPRQERLTPRECCIVKLIDEGLSNKEIARRLGIELSTVKNHVHHILEKLHALRRAQAAAQFRRVQLMTHLPEPPRSRS
jgi:DNA-binding NarL/FixJ family response regulator